VRAAVLHTPGEPPSFTEHPEPAAGDGRTRVRVSAAPVVPLDLLCASGTSYFGVPRTPYVPGVQGVGVVDTSDSYAAGQRVWFATSAGMAAGDGSLAELCTVADDDVVPLDTDVPDATVAALGLSAVAAWMALSWRAGLREGEVVAVLGGGGAVGQTGIGAAKALGAARVVAVARSAAAQERARRAGADAVVPHVDDVDALAAAIGEAAQGPVDVVLDPVFGVAATAASRVLNTGGRIVNLGGASGDEAVFSSSVLRSRSAEVCGYTNNSLSPEQRAQALSAVLELTAAGRISLSYDTLPLSEARAAWLRQSTETSPPRMVLLA
jgi:NADPH:quinone reductase-like Zn-dependent oxidoreductase